MGRVSGEVLTLRIVGLCLFCLVGWLCVFAYIRHRKRRIRESEIDVTMATPSDDQMNDAKMSDDNTCGAVTSAAEENESTEMVQASTATNQIEVVAEQSHESDDDNDLWDANNEQHKDDATTDGADLVTSGQPIEDTPQHETD